VVLLLEALRSGVLTVCHKQKHRTTLASDSGPIASGRWGDIGAKNGILDGGVSRHFAKISPPREYSLLIGGWPRSIASGTLQGV